MIKITSLLFVFAALLAWPNLAGAASFDCAKATTATEKSICADPALSQADSALADAYRAALAATLDPVALRRDQRQWRRERDLPQNQTELLKAFQSRAEALNRQAKDWRALPREFVAASLANKCFLTPEADDDVTCNVEETGKVTGGDGLRYQLQGFYQDKLWADGGAVVFADEPGGALTPIVSAYGDTAHFGRPAILTGTAGTFLLIPGHLEGTGNFNSEHLYLRVGAAWRDIDSDAWLNALNRRLPKGLAALKGIYPDYQAMTAATPLWKVPDDGNCCPTGGRAEIKLKLVGTVLMIDKLTVTLGAAAAEKE